MNSPIRPLVNDRAGPKNHHLSNIWSRNHFLEPIMTISENMMSTNKKKNAPARNGRQQTPEFGGKNTILLFQKSRDFDLTYGAN